MLPYAALGNRMKEAAEVGDNMGVLLYRIFRFFCRPVYLVPDTLRKIFRRSQMHACTYIKLLTNIDFLRGPERPPLFSLFTRTLRNCPLPMAEGARMPINNPSQRFSVFFFFFQN